MANSSCPSLDALPAELFLEVFRWIDCDIDIRALPCVCRGFREQLCIPNHGELGAADQKLKELARLRGWCANVRPDDDTPDGWGESSPWTTRYKRRLRSCVPPHAEWALPVPSATVRTFTVGEGGQFPSLRACIDHLLSDRFRRCRKWSNILEAHVTVLSSLDEGPEPIDLAIPQHEELRDVLTERCGLRIQGRAGADGASRPFLRARLRVRDFGSRGCLSGLRLALPARAAATPNNVADLFAAAAAAAVADADAGAGAGAGALAFGADNEALEAGHPDVDNGLGRCLTVGSARTPGHDQPDEFPQGVVAWSVEDCDVYGGLRVGGQASLAVVNCRVTGAPETGDESDGAAGQPIGPHPEPGGPTDVTTGVLVQGAAQCVVRSSLISWHRRSGVTVQQQGQLWLHHCRVSANRLAGVKMMNHARALLECCDISHNLRFGLLARSGAMAVVRGCELVRNKNGVALLGVARVRFVASEVRLSNVTQQALPPDAGTQQAVPFDQPLHQDHAGFGVVVQDRAILTSERSRFMRNHLCGALATRDAALLLSDCAIVENGAVGLRLENDQSVFDDVGGRSIIRSNSTRFVEPGTREIEVMLRGRPFRADELGGRFAHAEPHASDDAGLRGREAERVRARPLCEWADEIRDISSMGVPSQDEWIAQRPQAEMMDAFRSLNVSRFAISAMGRSYVIRTFE